MWGIQGEREGGKEGRVGRVGRGRGGREEGRKGGGGVEGGKEGWGGVEGGGEEGRRTRDERGCYNTEEVVNCVILLFFRLQQFTVVKMARITMRISNIPPPTALPMMM